LRINFYKEQYYLQKWCGSTEVEYEIGTQNDSGVFLKIVGPFVDTESGLKYEK
jgi:hypothetical protein